MYGFGAYNELAYLEDDSSLLSVFAGIANSLMMMGFGV